jgi:hypothetical protein
VIAKYSGTPFQGGRTSLWQKLVLKRPTTAWRVDSDGAWRGDERRRPLGLLGLGLGVERDAPEPDVVRRLAREVGVPSLFLLEPRLKAALPLESGLQ